ncbi:lipid A biosynthesis acyltransferase [Hymenobacter saemangeumensis]|uniref:Lipid A biosynthesis acyltransferase n=1 Tax=Hymenobacter saemangeumensis TaxID=1084522 RepID=A0ABP8ISV7_9BACT
MSKEWQGKSKANVTGYKIFGFFINTFGVRAAYFLLLFVASYYFLFSWKSSAPMLRFYQERLKFSLLKALGLLYVNYFRFGQTLIDKFAILAGASDGFTFHFDGEQHLREMVSLGRGGILLSAHAGNWEVAGQMLHHLNTPVNVVMYDGEDENIKQYLETRADKRFKVIFIGNDLSHIFKINEALAANELICMHADRFLPGNKTLPLDFLGGPALFPEGPFLLSLRLRVPMVYVYAFKETATHYHLFSTPVKHFSPANQDTSRHIATDFVAHLEHMVQRYPEQWFNYYDFWKAA